MAGLSSGLSKLLLLIVLILADKKGLLAIVFYCKTWRACTVSRSHEGNHTCEHSGNTETTTLALSYDYINKLCKYGGFLCYPVDMY